MKTKIIYSFLFSFLFAGLSYAQVTHITGDRVVTLPPASLTAIRVTLEAHPANLKGYEWISVEGIIPYVEIMNTIANKAFVYFRAPGIWTIRCREANKIGNNSWRDFVVKVLPYGSKSVNYNASIKKIMIEPEDREGISTTVYYQISNLTTSQVVDKGYIDNKTESIDVSKLSKGMYVLNMVIDENNKVSHKFIVK